MFIFICVLVCVRIDTGMKKNTIVKNININVNINITMTINKYK